MRLHVIQLTVLLFLNIILHDNAYIVQIHIYTQHTHTHTHTHEHNINNNIGIINDGMEYTAASGNCIALTH